MKNTNAYNITGNGITLFTDGRITAVPSDHPNFRKIVDKVRAGDFSGLVDLFDIRSTVRNWLSGNRTFALANDQITMDGRAFSAAITDKVLAMIDAGHAPDPLFGFLRKVRDNPSSIAQDELLLFCVANDFLIDLDGNILAYKSVRNDYKDIHSGTILNTVGKTVSIPRNAVDDNRDRTCSYGLHFASHQYASTWAGSDVRLLVLKVNPADVVSIPSDYNNQKGRTCKYEVIAEISDNSKLPKAEVYDTANLFATRATVAPKSTAAARVEIQAKIDRKTERLADMRDELDELDERINHIETLGGRPESDLLQRQTTLEDITCDITAEIEELDEELDSLR